MKTKFTFLTFLLASFITGFAQQMPNNGFETWTSPLNPDGWVSVENLLGLSSNVFTFKDQTTHTEGAASIKLVCDTLPGHPEFGVVAPMISLGSGSFNGDIAYSGIPFTYRPDTLTFDYKFTSTGLDTAAVFMHLTKQFLTQVVSLSKPLPPAANWVHVAILLAPYYHALSNPDTLLVQFTASNINEPLLGSTLYIDNVKLGYTSFFHASVSPAGPVSICAGDSVALQANTGSNYTYQWQLGGNAITGATDSRYVAYTSGSYTVQIDSANATDVSTPVVVTVNQPAITLTGLNDTICNNASSITLTGGLPAGGTYSGSGVTSSTFNPGTAALGLDTISYTAVDANSCTGTAKSTIFVEVCEGIQDLAGATVSVFPNPASSTININSNSGLQGFNMQIFDLTGRVVISQLLTGTDNDIEVSKLANGTYIYRITDKANISVVQHKLSIIK